MSAPRTPTKWIATSERLPDTETYGPYPRVLVAISNHNHPEYGFGLRFAELRFINGDRTRPTWVACDRDRTPVETYAYGVTHWAPAPEDPSTDQEPQ